MITIFSYLAMGRQRGVKYGRQYVIEPVQDAGMGKQLPQPLVTVSHQRLNTFVPAAGFS